MKLDEFEIRKEIGLLTDAIQAIYDGAQSYAIGTRSVTKANLGELLAERRRLYGELAELTTDGGRSLAQWPGR